MTLQKVIEFLNSLKLDFKSINPITFELKDINEADDINSSGYLTIDLINKSYSIKINIEGKF